MRPFPAASAGWPAFPPAASPPPLIGRDAARQLARRELAKSIYQQSNPVITRIWARIVSTVSQLVSRADAAVPAGWWILVVLAAVASIIAAVVILRLGPVSATRRARGGATAGSAPASARDHRERASQLAADRDWAGAILESLRAIAHDIEERGIVPASAGRTADELAVEAGRALPACAGPLRSAALLFDDVRYGDRPGTADGYARLRDLDADIRTTRPLPLRDDRAAKPAGQHSDQPGGPP